MNEFAQVDNAQNDEDKNVLIVEDDDHFYTILKTALRCK
jgi:ActR/RegA family two-component response regulator